MNDDEIKAGLSGLLAEAHKHKSRTDGWFAIGALLAVLLGLGFGYGLASDHLDFGGFGSFLVGVGLAVGALALFAHCGMAFDAWRARRWAGRFRDLFPEESGDYARALAILRASRTESKAEKDLLGALDKADPVSFDGAKMPKKGSFLGGGLLGGLGKKAAKAPEAAKQSDGGLTAKPKRGRTTGYMPLDPYES